MRIIYKPPIMRDQLKRLKLLIFLFKNNYTLVFSYLQITKKLLASIPMKYSLKAK